MRKRRKRRKRNELTSKSQLLKRLAYLLRLGYNPDLSLFRQGVDYQTLTMERLDNSMKLDLSRMERFANYMKDQPFPMGPIIIREDDPWIQFKKK
jgi:hypothetical protein